MAVITPLTKNATRVIKPDLKVNPTPFLPGILGGQKKGRWKEKLPRQRAGTIIPLVVEGSPPEPGADTSLDAANETSIGSGPASICHS